MVSAAAAIILFAGVAFGQSNKNVPPATPSHASATTMDEIFQDESHCLTDPEIRSDKDAPISCSCRDAIEEARYVYFTYLLSGRDSNLNGPFLVLTSNVTHNCGETNYAFNATTTDHWKWNGPEVVRTYPSDDVVARIAPETENGKPTGRWVPFTVQLVYRDVQGRVTRTDNYSSREFDPILPK